VALTSLRSRGTARMSLIVLCLALAAVGTGVARRIDDRAQPCWPVRQLLIFNRDAQASLKAKTRLAPAGSLADNSVPTKADYQAWLDGLQQHADQVTDPGLSTRAQRAAALAREFMKVDDQVNKEVMAQDPLRPTMPPSAKMLAQINHQFIGELTALAHACPLASGSTTPFSGPSPGAS
jgi:hypothetical protein